MSVNELLTGMAKSIRSMLGITGTMSLEEMAGHIDEESQNIKDAFQALTALGVPVPTYPNSTNLLEAVQNIGDSEFVVETGEFSTSSSTYTVQHGLNSKPIFIMLVHESGYTSNCTKDMVLMAVGINGLGVYSVSFDYTSDSYSQLRYGYYKSTNAYNPSSPISQISDTSVRFGYANIGYLKPGAGETYQYAICGFKPKEAST